MQWLVTLVITAVFWGPCWLLVQWVALPAYQSVAVQDFLADYRDHSWKSIQRTVAKFDNMAEHPWLGTLMLVAVAAVPMAYALAGRLLAAYRRTRESSVRDEAAS